MPENLLRNGDFEADWGDQQSHFALVVEDDGYDIIEVGNIFTPPDWLTWFDHRGAYEQPEVRDTWLSSRIHTGHKALLLFTFNRKHDAGLMQTVPATPGGRLRLSAFAHAWSNHDGDDFPHPDEPDWSEGAGYDCVRWLAPDIPPLNGDPQSDAKGNFAFVLGIDPTGDTDPTSDEIVWGDPAWIYNCYDAVPAVEAVAQSDTVTIYLRSQTLWAFKHNDAYWDDATLEVAGEAPSEARGRPREQYGRVYNVIPYDMPLSRATAIFERRWQASKETVGGSYDDAGVGDLNERVARLWGLPASVHPEFVEWYETHYPDVEVEFAYLEEPTAWDRDISDELAQGDEPWDERPLEDIDALTVHHTMSHSPHNTAIWTVANKSVGLQYHLWITETGEVLLCEPLTSAIWHDNTPAPYTHLSLGLAGNLEEHPPAEPQLAAAVEVAAWAVEHSGMGVTYETVKGHQDYYETACPGWHTGWREEFYRRLRERLGMESEPEPTPPAPEPEPTGGPTLSFHVQAGVEGLMEYIANVKPSVVKLCHQSGMARGIHEASPDTLIVYRKVYNEWHDWIYGYDNLTEAAVDFLGWMMPEIREIADAVGDARFAVEGLNETIATGALEDIRRVAQFEAAFAYQVAQLEQNVRACVLNTAVGNPQHGAETEMLIPAVRAAMDTGGYVGAHAYWPSSPTQTWLESDWRHFGGRWADSWDATFRAHGLRPRYLLTEGGPIGNSNEHLNAEAGWRLCIGDWNRTADELLRFDQLAHQSIPGQEGRYGGIALFTVGMNMGWEHFEFRAPQFESLAAALS